MARRVSKRASESKEIVLLDGEQVDVGVDTHKHDNRVAMWSEQRQAIVAGWVQPADPHALAKKLLPHKAQIGRIVYEAGPTGYSLARVLRKAGFRCDVVAPSRTPVASGQEAKSDRLDSRKLAMYSAKGLLMPVRVPTEQEEGDRQVVRYREQLMDKRRRVKQQIKSFLLMHGIAQPAGLTHWSVASIEALRGLRLSAQLRFVLDEYLAELAYLNAAVKRATAQVSKLAVSKRHCVAVRAMRTTPGVGLITAMTVRTELIAPDRFNNAREVGSMLGLVPRVVSTGKTRREGPLMRTGNQRLRTILVEAAWRWVAADPWAGERYRRLLANTANAKKAIVAMARRLGILLWRINVTRESYRPRTPSGTANDPNIRPIQPVPANRE